MGQMTIYLENEVETKVRHAAKSAHLSQSRWISTLINEKVANRWPQSVLELAGAWADLPMAEAIRNSSASDSQREAL